MKPASFICRTVFAIASLTTLIPLDASSAQSRQTSGALTGSVVTEDGRALDAAAVEIRRSDGGQPRTAASDAQGMFLFRDLPPGLYGITVRRIGYRAAQLRFIRVSGGQPTEVRVILTASPTQLSSVEVRVTATTIDATTTDLTKRLEVDDLNLLPIGREAGSLVDLLPGARQGFVWGGAGDAANNYQLDGVSVNHPGTGGDFLAPSIDWIESLEVRGLGAGAEYGGFQGGIINAVTRTGTNRWGASLTSKYISPALTTRNILPNEEGAEQRMRRELSGVVHGPLVRDRLFYFLGGLVVDRREHVPDLLTLDPDDVREDHQEFRDLRGIAKLTFRPGPFDIVDAAVGHTDNRVENAGLNGIDGAEATQRVRSPVTFYQLRWSRTLGGGTLDARAAGFTSRESRLGYEGDAVPGIQVFTRGRQPIFQNAIFSDRVRPRSASGILSWSKEHAAGRGSNRIVAGGEFTRGWWERTRTRNGGLTWMPYVNPTTFQVDPADPGTWLDVASEWGGEIRVDSRVEDAALFLQDYLTIVPGLTLSAGARYGRWKGWLTPADSSGARFLAAKSQAIDPRFGVVWDISGRSNLVFKASWGRYHQSMSSLFFDRAEGANAYTNERFYYQGPTLTDPRAVYTPAQRDANIDTFTGFSPTFVETILNEAGRVENYLQPYMEQIVASVEKRFGSRWKAELSFVNRTNRDIVGLVDRNLADNYSPLTNVTVRDRVFQTPIFDQHGRPLVLPTVWVSNRDLRNELIFRQSQMRPIPPVPGYTFADINRLTFNPDIVLTTVPDARRSMQQISASVRTQQKLLSWFGSATFTNLKGNVAGLTGFGTAGTDFTAGPGVRKNEQLNFEGRLPGFPAFEAKSWITGDLPYGLRAGAFVTYSLGEYFEPVFRITPRFAFTDSTRALYNDALFSGVVGQTLLMEERGSRKYPPVANLDLRLEKRIVARGVNGIVSAELFNAFGSDAITRRNLTVNDGTSLDPTSVFGAPRRRVSPLRLQLGFRAER